MRHFTRSLIAVCIVGVAVLAVAGCASHEALPSYYVLTPAETADSVTGNHRGTRIFIRRVTLPGYLESTSIASRRANNQIEYSSTAFWGEGHREGFGRALADALSRRPGIGAVSAPPLGIPPQRDNDLVVEIERFEGDDHGEVVLTARWQLYLPESAVPILSRESRFVQTGWTYGDEAGQARMLSTNVQELAAQIGQVVRR